MSPVAEIVLVWVPMACSAAFVAWFAWRCYREGMSPLEIMLDRRFLTVFLYSGALLAIYLSSLHFFYVGAF